MIRLSPARRAPGVLLVAVLASAAVTAEARAAATIESGDLGVTLRDDLNGIAVLRDSRSGRDYAAALEKPVGLYRIFVGRKPASAEKVASTGAVARSCRAVDGGVELRFDHEKPHPMGVTVTATADPARPFVRWRIAVENRTGKPISAVEFPIVTCAVQLGKHEADDAIVYPMLEGVLLVRPKVRFRDGLTYGGDWPGGVAAQFVYLFDREGGLYAAAHDPAGYPKAPLLTRAGDVMQVTFRHGFPSEPADRVATEYDVVLGAGGGSWQHGADRYRDWATQHAPWCGAGPLAGRGDVPAWLKRGTVFLNFSFGRGGRFGTVDAADAVFKAWRAYLGRPIVACAFGWEKHGAWIGPDYFPPRGGEAYWRDLSRRLRARGDHTHVFTSGFRWGVRKPAQVDRSGKKPRTYTDLDGRADWEARGQAATAVNAEGRHVFKQPPWADNYILCTGSQTARDVLADAFAGLRDLGISGVDLDQNLGAEVADCYSPQHGHPIGRGLWQHRAMARFLKRIRDEGRRQDPDAFIGVEEPCEAYIPWIDLVHGRAFTDTRWPVKGPGSVSIPLYIYLYHDYQLNYAGWIDGGFSPLGNRLMGLGRAFVFGMQLGVRINGREFEADPGASPSLQTRRLRDAARIIARCEPYLLLGRMLHDPVVTGGGTIDPRTTDPPNRPRLPRGWPAVQATAWRAADGTVCYALANLTDGPRDVTLRAVAHGMTAGKVRLTRVDADAGTVLAEAVPLPAEVPIALQPWGLCAVTQTPAP